MHSLLKEKPFFWCVCALTYTFASRIIWMIICTPSSGTLSSDTSYTLTLLPLFYQRLHTTVRLCRKQQFHQPLALPEILPNSQLLQSGRVALGQPEGDDPRSDIGEKVVLNGEGSELRKGRQEREEEEIHILIRQ